MRLGSVLPLTHSSTWRGADLIQRAHIRVLVEQVLCMHGLVFCDAMRRVLRRKLSVLEASPTTLNMWVRQVRSSERVIPRYLECLTSVPSTWCLCQGKYKIPPVRMGMCNCRGLHHS